MAKYKTTGCFKFLIFLIIAVPVAFLISSYYHGEDPLSSIKDKISTISESSQTDDARTDDSTLQINELRNQIRDLERENDNLSKLLKEKQKEIDALKPTEI